MVEKGILNQEELQRALAYQQQSSQKGRRMLLGQALLELGLVEREVLDEVITTQILQLQSALKEANRHLEQRVQERTVDLQRALDRLGELNHLKLNFIATISHELRTPLTHIKGYLDLLGDASLGPLTVQQLDALEVLQRAEQRLEHLIEDLIQFSLVSKGELQLDLRPVCLGSLIQSVAARPWKKIQTGEIQFDLRVPEDLPLVLVDEGKIVWVLVHLLDNAQKFTPSRGKVFLEAVQQADRVQVSISDTGIGIPGEKLEEIFEPFHQLDSSTTRHYGGTGLGLAMVHRILEAHGLQIRVWSQVGKGTRFEFDLPVATM